MRARRVENLAALMFRGNQGTKCVLGWMGMENILVSREDYRTVVITMKRSTKASSKSKIIRIGGSSEVLPDLSAIQNSSHSEHKMACWVYNLCFRTLLSSEDNLAEWLRRLTRIPLHLSIPFAGRGSSPLVVELLLFLLFVGLDNGRGVLFHAIARKIS